MKKLFTFIILCLFSFSLNALPFNEKLEESEVLQLKEGKTLIRNIKNKNNISIINTKPIIQNALEEIYEINPNYLAEIIQIRPIKGNEDLPQKMKNALENIPDYVGIPYYSSEGTLFELYSKADILSETKISETKTEYKVDLLMEPFSNFINDITLEKNADSVFYKMINTNKIKVKGINAINPNKMINCVILFKEEDNWILYGIGGVKAFKIPFFDKKMESSFIRRIQTFCNYIFTKI